MYVETNTGYVIFSVSEKDSEVNIQEGHQVQFKQIFYRLKARRKRSLNPYNWGPLSPSPQDLPIRLRSILI